MEVVAMEDHKRTMTALALIMAIGTLLLSGSTNASAEPKDGDLIATLPALVAAGREACDLDTLRSDPNWHTLGEFIPGITPPQDEKADRRNQDWLRKYNQFAGSQNARTLYQYAQALGLLKGSDVRLRDAECQILVPAYGVAATATALGVKPGDITNGPLTDTCEGGKCVSKDLKAVARQCETEFRSQRYAEWCRTPKREPMAYGTTGEKPANDAYGF
jgi:hypothetical protein